MSPLERWTSRVAFALQQGSRVAWYAGHGAIIRRMARRAGPVARKRPAPSPRRPVASYQRMLSDVTALFRRDLANIEAGLYPAPLDEGGGLPQLFAESRAFLRDAPEVLRRQRGGNAHEVAGDFGDKRPHYYLQNFHFQSGGWMTEQSARLYDMQVEVLFFGAAEAMRRQALVPLTEAMRGRDQRNLLYADIACGPGGFLRHVRQAFPRLPSLAVDLSEPYVAEAMRRLGRRPRLQPLVAKAEALPIANESLDVATAIFLFHELPGDVRRNVAREIGRVMKPGGTFILVDSLQTGDVPVYDGLLDVFPGLFHEPYFASYLAEDLGAMFAEADLALEASTNAFLAKVMSFSKR